MQASTIRIHGLSDEAHSRPRPSRASFPPAEDLSPDNPWRQPRGEFARQAMANEGYRYADDPGDAALHLSDEQVAGWLLGVIDNDPYAQAEAWAWEEERKERLRAAALIAATQEQEPQAQQREPEQAQAPEHRRAEDLSPSNPWFDPMEEWAYSVMQAEKVCRTGVTPPAGWRAVSPGELHALLVERLNANQKQLAAAWIYEDELQAEERERKRIQADGWVDTDSSSNDSSNSDDDDSSTEADLSGNTTEPVTVTVEHQSQPLKEEQEQQPVKAKLPSVEQEQEQCNSVEQGEEAQQDQAIATVYVRPPGYMGSYGTVGVPLRAEAICFNLKPQSRTLLYWGRVFQWIDGRNGRAEISMGDAIELLGFNRDAWERFTAWAEKGEWLEVVSTRNKVKTYKFGRAFLEADWVSINAEAQRQLDARRKREDRKQG